MRISHFSSRRCFKLDRHSIDRLLMSDSPTPQSPTPQSPTPLRCLLGAIVAAVLAYALYNMTSSIAISFATKPIDTDTTLIVQRISSAVRTLVLGMSAMGTGIFGLAALGLFALAIQLLFRKPDSSAN
jgi:hypothetical protein